MKVLFVSLFVVLADQISKLCVKGFSIPFLKLHVAGYSYAQQHNFIGSFLTITFVENPGMAFGLYFGIYSKIFLSLFSVVASIGIIIYLYKIRSERLSLRIALALILAGAVGNLIDRVFYGVIFGYAPLLFGRVVDFLEFNIGAINLFGYTIDRLPIFNLADFAVTAGVCTLLYATRKDFIPEKNNEALLSENNAAGSVAQDGNIDHDAEGTDNNQVNN